MATIPGTPVVPEAKAYEFLVQALQNPELRSQFLPELTEAGKQILGEIGFSSANEYNGLLQILHWAAVTQATGEETILAQRAAMAVMQPYLKKSTEDTFQVMAAMKKALWENLEQTTSAYHRTMWMYIVAFYTGVVVIAVALLSAWLGKDPFIPAVFGGLGTANMLVFFFTKPQEGLQRSRASLAQLQCALLAWYSDFYNGNTMMSQMQQQSKEGLSVEEFTRLSQDLLNRTKAWMDLLQNAVQQAHLDATPKPQEGEQH